MSLYAFLPRELKNLQHQVDPRAKGTVRVPRLNRSLGSGRDWTSAEKAPLPQCLALHRGSARDLVDLDVPCVASSVEPALDGRTRDSEEGLDLLSGDAAVDGGEHFQSEVLRVGVHGHYFM
jgi:hypothetical protein